MSLITGGGISDNIFKDLAQLQLAEVPNDRRLELITGERYHTSATDTGDGLLLAGGNYANLLPASDIEEAPVDGKPYSRKDAAWEEALPEAPIDGKSYARKDAAWAEVVSGGGGTGTTIITGDSNISTGDYIVTVDSVLTLEDGVLGDTMTISSLYGVASALIDSTQGFRKNGVVDNQFDLTTPNLEFTFTNNGTEWEI